MRKLITVLLSAALIWSIQQNTPVNKSLADTAKAKPVQVVTPEKVTDVAPPQQTQTEQEPASEPETPTVVTPKATQVPQGCAAYVPLLQQYDWNYRVMEAVMQAESSCNPNAVNPTNYDGVGDYGLMQLHGQEIFDPATNVAHAYAIWQRQGYHAWSTYNNGAYLRYM